MKNTYLGINAILLMLLLEGCTSSVKGTGNSSASKDERYIEASKTSELVYGKTADDYNKMGNQYLSKNNLDMALVSYQKGVQLDAKHANCLTGIATIYAKRNMFSIAIPIFEEVLKIAPEVKHYNNLGYAYYLNQQYAEANRVLSQAMFIDPSYEQAQNNLELVKQKLGQSELVELAKPLEVTPQPVAAAETTSPQVVANNKEVKSIETIESPMLIAKSEGVYQLNSLEKPADENHKQLIADSGVAGKEITALTSGGSSFQHSSVVGRLFDLATTGLIALVHNNDQVVEVVNGNGLKGVARAVVSQLSERGVENLKARDAKSFNIAQTHIQYRKGYRDDAVAINHHLINRPVLYRNDKLPPNVAVRLVLGRDIIDQTKVSELDTLVGNS